MENNTMPEKLNETIVNCFDEILKQHSAKTKQLITVNKMLTDIVHAIENDDNFNAAKGCLLSKKINQIRKKRRILKNELELLDKIVKKYKLHTNIKDYRIFKKIIIERANYLDNAFKRKFYRPKVIKNIDDFIHQKEIKL